MDYKLATVEELADYVEISSVQRITQQLMYHRKKGHEDIVEKIKAARAVVRRRKLVKLLETL
jgi:hypothetical protein